MLRIGSHGVLFNEGGHWFTFSWLRPTETRGFGLVRIFWGRPYGMKRVVTKYYGVGDFDMGFRFEKIGAPE